MLQAAAQSLVILGTVEIYATQDLVAISDKNIEIYKEGIE